MIKFSKIKKNKLLIPDNDMNGVEDTVRLLSDYKVDEMRLMVELDHEYPGDMSIELTAPNGNKEVFLSPGNNKEKTECFYLPSKKGSKLFEGGIKGEWSLRLIDSGMNDQGYLQTWEMEFFIHEHSGEFTIEDQSILELQHECSYQGHVNSLDLHVDIEHSHIGDLKISLLAPDGYMRCLHDKEGKDETKLLMELNSFELKDYKGRQAEGIWTLIIEDCLKGDTGILKEWSLKIGEDN